MTLPIENLTGRCRCGALVFSAHVSKGYGVCHCQSCRRWTSGVWMGVEVKGPAPDITGPLMIQQTSLRAERANCKACGSPIYYRLRAGPYFLSQGCFDDQSGWVRLRELYGADKPDHYGFGPDAPLMTGWAMVWAALTGKLPR